MPERSQTGVPEWLMATQDYAPCDDHDGFIARSMLSITSVLSHFRLDDGKAAKISPSAPAKLIFGFSCILLTSLSRNYFFTLVMLACMLVRLCFLSSPALRRTVAVAAGAAGIAFLVMVPAILFGQSHSALLVTTKVFVSVSVAMTVALTTPFNELTTALRVFHVPDLFIMTIDLALKNIVRLGDIALEVLAALKLRSVGRNRDKGTSLGGIGGMLFLKANEAAEATYAAMACRGFEGQYTVPKKRQWKLVDPVWFACLLVLILTFVYLQGLV